jgi:hypothetical protein
MTPRRLEQIGAFTVIGAAIVLMVALILFFLG